MINKPKKLNLLSFFLLTFSFAESQVYSTIENIPYYGYESTDSYQNERCKLDLYYPKYLNDFTTVVWFHGGGLKAGNKYIPEKLKEKGIAVIAVNYRLSPKVKAPKYINDAAAAVAWTFNNISKFGGNPSKIIVSGSSAGAYLTMMVGLDKTYLKSYGINADKILALFPLSGQTITHFTVRGEQNISRNRPIVDIFAPLYHVRSETPPVFIYTGDPELESYGRVEENAYFARMLKVLGNKKIKHTILGGYGHGKEQYEAVFPLMIREIIKLNK
tara:strand:- start:299 stop:1117 length:819 start_codon:yes stop_codon:yes gene_type:complete